MMMMMTIYNAMTDDDGDDALCNLRVVVVVVAINGSVNISNGDYSPGTALKKLQKKTFAVIDLLRISCYYHYLIGETWTDTVRILRRQRITRCYIEETLKFYY